MNFYPFHIGDYISHTSHLSDAEDLAYRRMIDLYYQGEEPFTSVLLVARKVKSTVDIVEALLEEFFIKQEDGWHNERADKEIAKYQSKATSARKANHIRWESKSDLKSDLKSDKLSELKSDQLSDTFQILTKNQEPITNNQENTNTKVKTPDGVSETVFQDFIKLRKGLKAPVTETALKGLQREAAKAGITLSEVLELCCQNGWRGFKADWLKDRNQHKTAGDRNQDVISGLTRGLVGGGNNVRLLGK